MPSRAAQPGATSGRARSQAITFGPGEDGWAVDNENISITKAVMATRIYALALMQILGVRQ